MLSCDLYLSPTTLAEAFGLMATHRGRFRLVAGATDTLPWARQGRAGDVHVPALIDVTRIAELSEIRVEGRKVQIGATAPVQRFLDHGPLMRALPCMPRCAIWFADDQIREQATVGGNIVNASPAADTAPALLVHGFRVELAACRDGRIVRRSVPLAEFALGPGQTVLEPDEIMTALTGEALPDYGGSFEKVGYRRSLVISLACLAALVKVSADGRRFDDVRLAVAGVGPVPRRLHAVEDGLRGAPIDGAELRRSANIPLDLIQSRTRREYRHAVLKGFIIRALISAARSAGARAAALAPKLEAAYA